MGVRTYPGRLTRDEWLRLSTLQRLLLASRAGSDRHELWRTCRKRPCRRAHACLDNVRCRLRPYEADWKNPNFGQPDYKSSFNCPEHLSFAWAVIKHLQFGAELLPAEEIVQECEIQGGADVAAAMRRVLRLQRRRRRAQTVRWE